MIDIYKLFAKSDPYISLFAHCCNTGDIAGRLWDLDVINKKTIKREHLCLLAAMHDIGKCHPSFQRKGLDKIEYINLLLEQGYLPASERKIRHELVSEAILIQKANRFLDKSVAKAFSKIVRLHHQKPDCNTVITPSPRESDWIKAQDALLQAIEEYFGTTLEEVSFVVSDAVCSMLWGIVILADWITSGEIANQVDNLFSAKLIPLKPCSEMFELDNLRPIQKKCEELAIVYKKKSPSIIIIEAPMGEGKTEAALYLAVQLLHAKNKNGIYIALPTTATARQMVDRLTKLLERSSIAAARLVHADAWLEQDVKNDEEIDKSWFAPTKRSLLSKYGVGTVDQAMMSVLRIKHGILRLLGLQSKVLIIDEMHAYDTYMQTIIFRLIEWCLVLDIPVIILSATLPNERKRQILDTYGIEEDTLSSAYPLITSIYNDGTVKESKVDGAYMTKEIIWENCVFTTHANVASMALDKVKYGGCACIIMNSVNDAQDVYLSLKEATSNDDIKLLLFHAKFLAKDRRIIEKECLQLFSKETDKRPARAILVATQVVEQSLDVDFDYMISALAPIDLLLQRCGRLHRHQRCRPKDLRTPYFTVLINADTVEDTGIGRVYDTWVLKQTQKVIFDIKKINIPSDIRGLIEQVYNENTLQYNSQDENFNQWIKKKSKEQIFEGQAKNVIFPKPEDDWFFPLETNDFFEENSAEMICSDALTRIGRDNIRVALLPKELFDSTLLINPPISDAKKIMEYTIKISIPVGSYGIELTGNLIECGGVLRNIYAMLYREEFTLQFKNGNRIISKKYIINAEYGIREEK